MRITNRMMTNNMMSNINGNKNRLSKLEDQYSTGLKIQKPSDDPIVAVRALKLRTNLSELTQYYEKNIPDAKSWMDVTESALTTVSDILTEMNTYCVQGSTDTLTSSDRDAIVANLEELKDQIYQEGNSNYAGRYVFTGYKTDTSLVFDEQTTDYQYDITEKHTMEDVSVVDYAINSIDLSVYDADNPTDTDLSDMPNTVTSYRVRLAYDNLLDDDTGIAINLNPVVDEYGNYEYDTDGNLVYGDTFTNITVLSSTDPSAYQPADGEINFLADTGELILAADVYNEWKNSDPETQFHVTYQKDTFEQNDLRPEHYFDCVRKEFDEFGDPDDSTAIEYNKANQPIEYEVNFNQKLVINTQGSDSITHDIGRFVDDIIAASDAVAAVESKISEVETMLEDGTLTDDQKTALNSILDALNTEKTIKDEMLQNAFENAITEVSEQQNIVSVAESDLGSRYVRLELTESRLSTQQDDFTDLLSQNEDADLVETVINYNAAETIYTASLNAASKVVQNSLLDFL